MIGQYFGHYYIPGIALIFTLVIAIKILSLIPITSNKTQELVRKSLHISMGSICLSFPWVFQNGMVVSLLAFISTCFIWVIRYWRGFFFARMKSVICSSSRRSYGEFYFPVAVAVTFILSAGEPVSYIVPIAILTFADASSALFGVKWGKHPFKYLPFKKSYEGSLAFFIVAFLVSSLGLTFLTDMENTHVVLVSLLLAVFTTLIEALCPVGLDNFMVPVGALFILKTHMPMSPEDILLRLIVMITLPGLLLLDQRKNNLIVKGRQI